MTVPVWITALPIQFTFSHTWAHRRRQCSKRQNQGINNADGSSVMGHEPQILGIKGKILRVLSLTVHISNVITEKQVIHGIMTMPSWVTEGLPRAQRPSLRDQRISRRCLSVRCGQRGSEITSRKRLMQKKHWPLKETEKWSSVAAMSKQKGRLRGSRSQRYPNWLSR